jgi:hypothetical protein
MTNDPPETSTFVTQRDQAFLNFAYELRRRAAEIKERNDYADQSVFVRNELYEFAKMLEELVYNGSVKFKRIIY